MAELDPTVPETVLAVYAHPDDPEVACGGTLAQWAAGGAMVHLVIVCAGEKGTLDGDVDPGALQQQRAEEVGAAARLLGLAGHEVLGYPDGEVEDGAGLRREVVRRIRTLKPDAVLCPDPTAAFFGRTYINHRDHRAVGWATLDAVAPAAWSPLYFPDDGSPHRVARVYLSGTLDPDVFVDIGPAVDVKAAAIRCHGSQLRGSAEVVATAVQERAEQAGRAVGVRYAEGFRLLTPS